MDRDKDRDVTEKIALGLPSTAGSQEGQFDQRLFNQSKVYVLSLLHTITLAFYTVTYHHSITSYGYAPSVCHFVLVILYSVVICRIPSMVH